MKSRQSSSLHSPHSDDLFRFSYSIFKIEYIIFKLFGLFKLVQGETGFTFASPPSIGTSAPAPPRSLADVQATPQGPPQKPSESSPRSSP
jgi:hypothetical protein